MKKKHTNEKKFYEFLKIFFFRNITSFYKRKKIFFLFETRKTAVFFYFLFNFGKHLHLSAFRCCVHIKNEHNFYKKIFHSFFAKGWNV